MATMDDIRAAATDLARKASEFAGLAAGLAALVAADPTEPPPPDPDASVVLNVTATTASSITVQWSTDLDPDVVRSWVVGRDGTDAGGTGPWHTIRPDTEDRFTFGSLRPGSVYTLSVAPLGVAGMALASPALITAQTAAALPPVVVPPVTGSGQQQHGPRALADGWPLREVTRDDFTGPTLDLTKWSPYNSAGHVGNGLRRPSQIDFVDDAGALGGRALRITGTPDGTTGAMANRRSQRYGRWAVRMRCPSGDPRYHPVALTWPTAENWMRGGGEIDFGEGKASVNTVQFFLHYSTSGGQSTEQTTGSIDVDITAYHWWEVEWSKTGVIGWCDGREWFRDTNPRHFSYDAFGAHHGCLQLDWFPEGAKTTGPAVMLVDAFRVYTHPDTTT